MRKRIPKILVTGGAGFMGSAFLRVLLKKTQFTAVVVDKLSYAGDLRRIKRMSGVKFYKEDICNQKKTYRIFNKERPDIVIHFAAESHVDRSIDNVFPFIETNVNGTHRLLEASRRFDIKKFIFISTDEVYGEVIKGKAKEDRAFKPSSPYAASKAAADLLVQSYIRTYGFPAIIIRPCNNYGPWQFPEKFIPVLIASAIIRGKLPIYGKGENVREWIYVDDCAEGILRILMKGKIGEAYNIGSGMAYRNIDTAKIVLGSLGIKSDILEFIKDRPGHDKRYSLNCNKMNRSISWLPKVKFRDGIKTTVKWYLDNFSWVREGFSLCR